MTKLNKVAQMPEKPEVVEKYYLLFDRKVLKSCMSLYYHEGIPVYRIVCLPPDIGGVEVSVTL